MIAPLFETWAQGAVERMLNSLPEGLLIALFAWAVLRVLPKQNSRTRFAVWFFALLAVACVPWADGLLTGARNQARILGPASGATSVFARLGSASIPSAISLPQSWAPSILLIWLLTTLIILMRLAVGLWHLRQLQRSCRPVEMSAMEPSLRQTLDELRAAKSFATRPATLAISDRVRVPAALGLWSPTIVLPTWAVHELPTSDLSIILRHEFAHLRRWDDWTNLAQKVVRALFFFHPAVWWIESRLSVEREMACDDVVVAQTDNPTGYANCLVSLLERSLTQRGWMMAQAIVHRAREASLRLARILDKNRPSGAQTAKPALCLIGVLALLCLVAVPYTPQVVTFERTPQVTATYHSDSAALVRPPIVRASLVQRASVPRSSAPRSSPASIAAASNDNHPASKGRSTLAQDASPGSGWNEATSPERTAQVLAPAIAACDPDAEKPCGFSRRLRARQGEANDNSLSTAAPETLLEVNAFAEDGETMIMPTLVVVHATQQLDSDSGSVVWRIQIWRLTMVNTVWKSAPQVPVAHST